MVDFVNNPPHYTSGGIECIDAIQSSMSQEAYIGWLKGNIIKYLWRYTDKGGVEDLKKAQFYLNRMIKVLEDTRNSQISTTFEKNVYPPPSATWPGPVKTFELLPRNGG